MKYTAYLRIFIIIFASNFLFYYALGQNNKVMLQPYEILSIDNNGNPTFIDFISTEVKSDDKSIYEFLKNVYAFDENTTFLENSQTPFVNSSFLKINHQLFHFFLTSNFQSKNNYTKFKKTITQLH